MNRDKSILGLHIDDDSLNIVHLRQTADGLEVRNWAAEHLESRVVEDGLIVDEHTVSQKIRDFTKANQLKSCRAIMSLPCSTVRLKPSEFHTQTDEQLQKQVEDQVGKYTLFEGERIVFDYCTFEESAQSSGRQIVLQAVTTRQISDACLAVAKQARLDLTAIEPAVMPIIKMALNRQAVDSQAVSLLLVLDSASGNLSVFKKGLPQLCQNLSVGTKDLSQGKDGFAHLMKQMKPVLEFARSFADSQQLVLKVAAACNSENLGAVVGQLGHSLSDVTVEQIDQSRIVREFDLRDADGTEVPFFALSCALTTFGVCELDEQLNLISQESLTIQKTQKEMSLTAKAVAAVVLLSIAASVPLKMKIRSVEAVSTEIDAKVTETIPIRDKITGLKSRIRQLRERQSAYDATIGQLTDIPWAKALQVIGNAVPDKVRVVDISTTDSGDLTLLGEALAERNVYTFARELQNDKFIESANAEEIEYDDSGDAILVCYRITCKIRIPEGD